MYNIQQGLIEHIKSSNLFKTVEEYAGQIKGDGIKATVKHPSALIMNLDGRALRNFKNPMRFDIIVITESNSFNRKTKTNDNLKTAADLMNYLDKNPGFGYLTYSFLSDQESLSGEMYLQNDRYTIILLHLRIRYL